VSEQTYYRDHWIEVESDRIDAYEQMFAWRPQMAPLLEPAALEAGQTVLDYGCGPGQLALELGRRVGAAGQVIAIDINDVFVERAREHAAEQGLAGQIEVRRFDGREIPLDEKSVDRVVCKNVLEYVDDVDATLREMRRVTRPGGKVHVIDSDWGLLVVEPLGPERIAELFHAAEPAYKTPLVGRRLYGAFRRAGLRDVSVRVLAAADTAGFAAPVVRNMASYARQFRRMPVERIDALLADLDRAVEEESYLLLLPQFLVTGTA
jgi:ubiquinone/menaquinone biosynthesis C-methylase UbiE